MRFMVFSVGCQYDLITHVATRVLMTPAKNAHLFSEYCCASRRHQGCQIEEAETSVDHRFIGSSSDKPVLAA
jgi:hypothetical protein